MNQVITLDAIPSEVREAFKKDNQHFPTQLQQFQYYDKYARFNWDLGRRETWEETVDRTVEHLRWLIDTYAPTPEVFYEEFGEDVLVGIRDYILNQEAMPSMRMLSQAGPAARRNGLAIYNCSYVPVSDVRAFSEAMTISMSGCGVGYSVERPYVDQFPVIQPQTGEVSTHVVVDDSEGWSQSLLYGLKEWFAGRDVEFDYSPVRGKGSVLKTKGGRASGPAPLKFVHNFCREVILSRQGEKLSTVNAHDMMCAVGEAAVSGGVRRTAMIALFSWDDNEMRTCKDGRNLDLNPIRWNANNSAVWPDDISREAVIRQMRDMDASGRGEPGIFSRQNAKNLRPERRADAEFGTNPCGEINLRPYGLCNLSIAVGRADDTVDSLETKVGVAAIIGTIQSLSTHFPGMRNEWVENCEEERLLGVDITGERDAEHLMTPENLAHFREVAVATNKFWAEKLGINQSASVTCNKPSGNSSTLLDCSSGIHARWAPFYIRRTRVSASTPLYRVLLDSGVPMRPENGQTAETATSWVVSWPVKAPEGAKTRKDISAVDQCEWWLMNKVHWTEHNPSVTITYQPEEFGDLVEWVLDHMDLVGGMAFLPADPTEYDQAPYEEISESEYDDLVSRFPDIDFSLLYAYEQDDMTTASQELACLAGSCDI